MIIYKLGHCNALSSNTFADDFEYSGVFGQPEDTSASSAGHPSLAPCCSYNYIEISHSRLVGLLSAAWSRSEDLWALALWALPWQPDLTQITTPFRKKLSNWNFLYCSYSAYFTIVLSNCVSIINFSNHLINWTNIWHSQNERCEPLPGATRSVSASSARQKGSDMQH